MATNLEYELVQDACDVLIQLEPIIEKVTTKNLEIKEIHNVNENMKKNPEYVKYCECLEVPSILLRVMQQLGLENYLASITMLPALVDEYRRKCQSSFRNLESTSKYISQHNISSDISDVQAPLD